MSGIVGAIGVDAYEAVSKMCKTLAHRGSVHRSIQGELADGTEYAVSALGLATLREVSNQHGSVLSASDSYCRSYARARIINSFVLKLDRDAIGPRPLFYGVNDARSLCAFASERKALWAAGIKRLQRVDPRSVVTISGLQDIEVKIKKNPKLSHKNLTYDDELELVNRLRNLLECVLHDLAHKRMIVAFSGGVDSALLCKLISSCANYHCYTIGLPGSHDLNYAQHVARLMNLDLEIIELNEDDLEMFIPVVIEAIESCNPLDIAIALPLYVLAKQAGAAGYSSVLTGQGADELFAGYSKYTSEHLASKDTLNDVLKNDIRNIGRYNLERDNLAMAAHSLDVVLPYLDPRVVGFGLALDATWKLRNGINKYALRKVAEQVMPHELAYRQKKAIQYGTGVSSMLQRLARKKMRSANSRGVLSLYLRSIADKQGIMVAE